MCVEIKDKYKKTPALTLYWPMFPTYKIQLVDLQSKSTDWFLYDGNIGR